MRARWSRVKTGLHRDRTFALGGAAVCLVLLLIALLALWRRASERLDHSQDAPILEAARRYKLDPALVKAVVWRESRFHPGVRGRAGEIGLMQILPATGRLLGVSAAEVRDPAVNIDTGARYLAIELRACGGDVACATAAYNGGPRARTNPLPSTRRYVAAVLARRATVLLPGMPATGQGEAVTAATVPAAGGRSRGATVAREE